MYLRLIQLMVLVALLALGMSVSDFEFCRSRHCLQKIEKGARDVLKVDWQPISVFPEEAQRLQKK